MLAVDGQKKKNGNHLLPIPGELPVWLGSAGELLN